MAFISVLWVAKAALEPPSDATMLRQFQQHAGTFTTSGNMVGADQGLDQNDGNWTTPADTRFAGVSPERLAEYRRLLRDAGVPRGFQVAPGCDGWHFFAWLRGSAISDDTGKGFSYRPAPPPNQVESLDGIRVDSRTHFVAYRHIRGNWYLFYEFVPN